MITTNIKKMNVFMDKVQKGVETNENWFIGNWDYGQFKPWI